jgi:hypothetical protein
MAKSCYAERSRRTDGALQGELTEAFEWSEFAPTVGNVRNQGKNLILPAR